MLRRDSSQDPAVVSDRELGLAALLLLVTVVLTALVVPALG